MFSSFHEPTRLSCAFGEKRFETLTCTEFAKSQPSCLQDSHDAEARRHRGNKVIASHFLSQIVSWISKCLYCLLLQGEATSEKWKALKREGFSFRTQTHRTVKGKSKGEYRWPEQVGRMEEISSEGWGWWAWGGECAKGVDRGSVQRGEAAQSLQMFYSEGEIITGLWFYLILVVLTGSFRRESLSIKDAWCIKHGERMQYTLCRWIVCVSCPYAAAVTLTCECKSAC